MKKIVFLLAMVLTAFISFSCSELQKEVQPQETNPKDELSVSVSKEKFEPEGGELSIEVRTNINFTYSIADECKDWIIKSDTKALSTKTLYFNISENEGTDDRIGTITVKSSLGDKVIKIYQNGSKPTIIISQTKYSISAEGDTLQVTVKSNVNAELSIPEGCDWITELDTKVFSSNIFYLCISENTSLDNRMAEILIKNVENDLTEKIIISQSGRDMVHVESVSLDKSELELFEGEQMTLFATVFPENADNKNLSWKSSNNSVAEVKDGIITAKSRGTAVITVTSKDRDKNATCRVIVSNDYYNLTTDIVIDGKISDMSRLIVLMPCPSSNEYQEISDFSITCGELQNDNRGNHILVFDEENFTDIGSRNAEYKVSEIFKYKSKKVKIDFNNKQIKNDYGYSSPSDYLGGDDNYIDINNPKIKAIAESLWNESSDRIDYARRCYEYVAQNFKYINGSWRTLQEILKIGGGECGDFTTVFVTLMRCKGIPSRHNIGIWKNGGFHVWPDFYDDNYGWIPLDPTFKNSDPNHNYFGIYDGDLIIVNQGLTTFKYPKITFDSIPFQTYCFFYWVKGSGNVTIKDSFSICKVNGK